MPYASQAQAAYFHAHKKELEAQGVSVAEWDAATKGKKLPKRAKKKACLDELREMCKQAAEDKPLKAGLRDVRQKHPWTCGPSALSAISNVSEEQIAELAGTTEEHGTTPDGLVEAARKIGLNVKVVNNMTVEQLKQELNHGRNVICDIQAWGDPSQYDKLDDGHYVAACFCGDTKIPLLDGKVFTIKQLAEGAAGSKFWVYSCTADGLIMPGEAVAHKTGKRKLVKVTLDNDLFVRCTADHLFMLRDGNYAKAKDLKPGASLMPLYRYVSNTPWFRGYEQVYNPKTETKYFTHRIVAVAVHKENIRGRVVHHIDFDKRNNAPSNLQVMTKEAHREYHTQHTLGKYARSEEGRAKSRELMQKLWADPEWRAKMLARKPEISRKNALKLSAEGRCGLQTLTPEKRKAMQVKISITRSKRIFRHSAESRAKMCEAQKKRFKDPQELEAIRKLALKASQAAATKARLRGMTDKQRAARKANSKIMNEKKAKIRQNHKVVSVLPDGFEDVYDLSVDKHHNFALDAGVFVHNCGSDDQYIYFEDPGISGTLGKLTPEELQSRWKDQEDPETGGEKNNGLGIVVWQDDKQPVNRELNMPAEKIGGFDITKRKGIGNPSGKLGQALQLLNRIGKRMKHNKRADAAWDPTTSAAVGALLGGGLGALSVSRENEETPWKDRITGGLIGALLGGGAGYGLPYAWPTATNVLSKPGDRAEKKTLRKAIERDYADVPGQFPEAVRKAQMAQAQRPTFGPDAQFFDKWKPEDLDNPITAIWPKKWPPQELKKVFDRQGLNPDNTGGAAFKWPATGESVAIFNPKYTPNKLIEDHEYTHESIGSGSKGHKAKHDKPIAWGYGDALKRDSVEGPFEINIPSDVWNYAATAPELDSRIAEIKRDYARRKGILVDTEEKAEDAIKDYRKTHETPENFRDKNNVPRDEGILLDIKNPRARKMILQRMLELVNGSKDLGNNKMAAVMSKNRRKRANYNPEINAAQANMQQFMPQTKAPLQAPNSTQTVSAKDPVRGATEIFGNSLYKMQALGSSCIGPGTGSCLAPGNSWSIHQASDQYGYTLPKQADSLPGGEADNMSDSEFPAKQLAVGKQHETEHTNNPTIAKEIAKDHLSEDKMYYQKIKELEKAGMRLLGIKQ